MIQIMMDMVKLKRMMKMNCICQRDQFSDSEEDDRVERSHNSQNYERFYMKDRLSENGFYELFGFSKSDFETIMTLVAPSMNIVDSRGNPMPLYSKVQAALLVLRGNSFMMIAGKVNGISTSGCWIALHEFVESFLRFKSDLMTLPTLSEAKRTANLVKR